MRNFTSIEDVPDPAGLVQKTRSIKQNPYGEADLGRNRVLGLVFFNSSLRTRMSTARAAYNLGMNVITLNVSADSWQLEFADGVVMDKGSAEHIKDAIPVMSSYCDIIGVRSFPTLVDKKRDYTEQVLNSFINLSSCPVVNLESATLHPLQSLADWATIEAFKQTEKPKVVMTWAPHVKPLPHAVPNSFAQWMNHTDFEFVITHPEGLQLDPKFSQQAMIETNQDKALAGADFIYVKNWSSYQDYGKLHDDSSWMMTKKKLDLTNNGKLMHCLPLRRNVVIADDAMDSDHSIIYQQAENRLYAAQAVLSELLKNMG